MDDTLPVSREPVPTLSPDAVTPPRPSTAYPSHVTTDLPFISNMEEISFWITTKQAPCLYNYDNVIKRQCEQAQRSKPKSVQSMLLGISPKKKKKRKLSLLDDESVSTGKQQNVYFDSSQNKTQPIVLDSCKSDTFGSDLDFNIKSPSMRNKSKRAKLNKSNRTTVHKRNKIATSTPKAAGTLRRSLRKTQRNIKNNSHLNDSFEVFNCEIINSNNTNNIDSGKESAPKAKKSSAIFTSGDQSSPKQKFNKTAKLIRSNNGQLDDMSDVSGFTANYIRSTKIHSSKKLRITSSKRGRNLMKASQDIGKKHDNSLIICLNKSVNTGMSKAPLMNSSMDSSQNVLNLVTLKNNDKSTKVSRSTSLLKFMDARNGNNKSSNNMDDKGIASNNINVSFNSKSSITSRYPIRHKNSLADGMSPINYTKKCSLVVDNRVDKNTNDFNDSDRKENPVENMVSRTRSGKCIGLMLRQPENSVLVLSNSVDPVSSLTSINVASPNVRTGSRSKRRGCMLTKALDSAKKKNRNEHRGSLRDKSGFTACFSDSDEDYLPIKHKKFFC
ncbi:unnamed protein product [Diatraea saccharalis]|uniref:Uncharacterized protein n=1 Tax=Diatraea saccharalis TaxID=40085 RepID=A0A9N9QYM8_9NEOP|nr:unnamed protein product [Diatraea saccharalis]